MIIYTPGARIADLDLVEKAQSQTPAGKLPSAPAPRRPDRTCDACVGTGRAGPLVVCRPCGGSGWEQTWEDRVRRASARALRNTFDQP